MTVRSLASKSIAVLLYVAYAMLPVGLALLAAGLLNANARAVADFVIAAPSRSNYRASLQPAPISEPAASTSHGTHPAWTQPADADRISTSSASHGQREAVRTVAEPSRLKQRAHSKDGKPI